MIELPEAVGAIDEIAAVAGFSRSGTNDLTASVLGLGRRDPALTTARVTEPPVLDASPATVRAGTARGVAVSVCGDAASDPAVLPELLAPVAGCSRSHRPWWTRYAPPCARSPAKADRYPASLADGWARPRAATLDRSSPSAVGDQDQVVRAVGVGPGKREPGR